MTDQQKETLNNLRPQVVITKKKGPDENGDIILTLGPNTVIRISPKGHLLSEEGKLISKPTKESKVSPAVQSIRTAELKQIVRAADALIDKLKELQNKGVASLPKDLEHQVESYVAHLNWLIMKKNNPILNEDKDNSPNYSQPPQDDD